MSNLLSDNKNLLKSEFFRDTLLCSALVCREQSTFDFFFANILTFCLEDDSWKKELDRIFYNMPSDVGGYLTQALKNCKKLYYEKMDAEAFDFINKEYLIVIEEKIKN